MFRTVFVVSALLCVVGIACSRGPANNTSAATPPGTRPAAAPAPAAPPSQGHCLGDLKITSDVLHPQPDVVVIDWVIDVANSCAEPHDIRATYQAWSADNVLLQSDQQDLSIEASGRARASGLMRMTPEAWARVTRRAGVAEFR
jgi:hypothetical protein